MLVSVRQIRLEPISVRALCVSHTVLSRYFFVLLVISDTVSVEIFAVVYSGYFKVVADVCVSLCASDYYCYFDWISHHFCNVLSGWSWTLDSYVDICGE